MLTDFAARLPIGEDYAGRDVSPVRRTFVELMELLAAQEAAWAQTDSIAADLAARLNPDPAAYPPTTGMRRQHHRFREAAPAAGLLAAEA